MAGQKQRGIEEAQLTQQMSDYIGYEPDLGGISEAFWPTPVVSAQRSATSRNLPRSPAGGSGCIAASLTAAAARRRRVSSCRGPAGKGSGGLGWDVLSAEGAIGAMAMHEQEHE